MSHHRIARRKALSALQKSVLAAILGIASLGTVAQEFPSKPIRLVVAGASGGNSDAFARLLAQNLSVKSGWNIVVENRGGAGGTIAANVVAKAAPDGYTLLLADTGTHAIAPTLYGKHLQYDVVKDFTPITLGATFPIVVIANTRLPAKTVKELVKLDQEKPGTISYSSGGVGNGSHLTVEMMAAEAGGMKLVHVPYKGGAPAVQALLANDVQLTAVSVGTALPYIKSGAVHPIGVASKKRSPVIPNVPTFAESGINVDADNWLAVVGPAGMPPEVVQKLNKEIRATLVSPAMEDRLASMALVASGSSPEELKALIISEAQKWGAVVKRTGAMAD